MLYDSFEQSVRVSYCNLLEGGTMWRVDILFDKTPLKVIDDNRVEATITDKAQQFSVDGLGECDIKAAAALLEGAALEAGFTLSDARPLPK